MKMKEFEEMFNQRPTIDIDGEFDQMIADSDLGDDEDSLSLDRVKESTTSDFHLSFMNESENDDTVDDMYVGTPDYEDEFDTGSPDELDIEEEDMGEAMYSLELDDDEDSEALDDADED